MASPEYNFALKIIICTFPTKMATSGTVEISFLLYLPEHPWGPLIIPGFEMDPNLDVFNEHSFVLGTYVKNSQLSCSQQYFWQSEEFCTP